MAASSTHCIALFLSFLTEKEFVYDTRLLPFSTLEDEICLNADEHIAFVTYLLEFYDKYWSNVRVLIDDRFHLPM